MYFEQHYLKVCKFVSKLIFTASKYEERLPSYGQNSVDSFVIVLYIGTFGVHL